ncbi:MAG: glucose 1-dehydrogenase [Planctomycetota bacterium]
MTTQSTRFDGKVALVTGATSGIGRDSALAFAREGASVVFTGRRQAEGESLKAEIEAAGGKALFVQGDVTDEAHVASAVSAAVETFGGLHAAFNNAGTEGQTQMVADFTSDNYRKLFDINVLGVILSMKHQVPALLKSGGGAIVNNSSVAGLIGMAGAGMYISTKHAVLGLTKSVALELAPQGVRVNAVCPGGVETELLDRFAGGQPDALVAYHPIGRLGKPHEITNAVLFLCSDESSFMTGVAMPVDGGFVAQ